MTNEMLEKIEKASINQSLSETEYYGEDLRSKDFESGIIWFKKNLWHPLSDIPVNEKEVIVKCKDTHDGRIFFAHVRVHDNWEKTLDRLSLFRVIEWFYMEDLL